MMSTVPIERIHVAEYTDELQLCRICLASAGEAKLLNIFTHRLSLAQYLEEVTGCEVDRSDGLPPFVCSFCSHLLHRFNGFRQRCLSSRELLLHLAGRDLMSTNYLNSTDKKYFKPLLRKTNMQHINLDSLGEITENECNFTVSTHENQTEIVTDEIKLDNNSEDHFLDDEFDEQNDYKIVVEIDENKAEDIVQNDTSNTDNKTRKKKHKIKTESSEYDSDDDEVLNVLKLKKTKSILKKDKPKSKGKVKKRNANKKQVKIKEEIDLEDVKEIDEKYENAMAKIVTNNVHRPNIQNHLAAFCRDYNFEIIFLSKEDQIKEIQARKESKNYKYSCYKCDVCFRGFTVQSTYENHVTTHHSPKNPYVCDICGFRYNNRNNLGHHLYKRHSKSYTCKQCGATFKHTEEAKRHHNWHSGNKYTCEHCGKQFLKKTTKLSHVRLSHGSVQCAVCEEHFVSQRGLHFHVLKAHKEALCTSCNVHFYSTAALTRHAPEPGQCDPALRPCVQCGSGFKSEEALKDHVSEIHEQIFICELCKKPFTNKNNLRIHVWKVHSFRPKPVSTGLGRGRGRAKGGAPRGGEPRRDRDDSMACVCEVCGKLFKTTQSLSVHLLTHTSERPFGCTLCPKTFRSLGARTYHMRIHTGEKPHACPTCGKTFRLPNTMKLHLATHTGERNFPCSVCPKAFRQPSHRIAHMRTHTQERPYECRICQKRFITSGNAREHADTVHLGLPPRNRHKRRV